MSGNIVAIAVLVILLVIVLRMILVNAGKRWRFVQSMTTPEERALAQLTTLRARLSSLSSSQYQRHAYRNFKPLKTAMVVYFRDRYGVTVRETIGSQMMSELLQRFPGQVAVLEKHKALFDEMEHVRQTGLKHSDMCEVCDKAIALLEKV